MSRWITVIVLLLTGSGAWAQTILTRQEAGQIALQFAQAGNYPGTIGWLTVNDLPERMEVDEEDTALIRQLAAEDKDWSVTLISHEATWFGAAGPFNITYVYRVTPSQWPDRLAEARVNAFTGYCELHPLRHQSPEGMETNDQLGYGHLPVKSFSELQQIALNIAEQMLGPGTFEVFTEPYDLANPAHYEAISKGGSVFVIFKKDLQTGAHLPQVVELYLNSRAGAVEAGAFYKQPVLVNTAPTLSEAQAKSLAATYIAQLGYQVTGWLPEGNHWFEGIIHNTAMGRDAVVGLYVVQDNLLEQYLMWLLIFTYAVDGETNLGMVMVNAHTGQVVLGFSSAAHLGQPPQKTRAKEARIEVPFVHINNRPTYLYTPMQLLDGRVYIWEEYADNFGAKWDGHRLRGARGSITLTSSEKLKYKGQTYIPLRRLCEVTGMWLWFNDEHKVPVLRAEWLKPKYPLAQPARLPAPSQPLDLPGATAGSGEARGR